MTVEYLTTQEVAALCRTSPETVRFWRYAGKGPASFKCGRRVLYPKAGVQRWLSGLQRDEDGTQV
jgi:excisionase family DNA binding protein